MILQCLAQQMSSRKALSYVGASKNMLYYRQVSKKRHRTLDDTIAPLIKILATARPAYGTRRLAAMASRELKRPINRKHVQRICREMGPDYTCNYQKRGNKTRIPQGCRNKAVSDMGGRHHIHTCRRILGILLYGT